MVYHQSIMSLKYIIFLLMMTISEIHTIPTGNGYLSMEFGFVYSSIFICGIIPAALMKALSTFFSQLYLNMNYEMENKILFKVGHHLVSYFLALGVYFVVGENLSMNHPIFEIIAQGAAIFIYFFINNVFLNMYKYLETGKPWFKQVTKQMLLEIKAHLVSIPAGISIVSIHNSYGFVQMLFIIGIYTMVVYMYVMYHRIVGTNRELAALYDVAATITSTLDQEKVMDIVLNSVQNIAPWDTACLYVYQNGYLVPAIYEGFNKEDFKNVKLEPDNQTGIINNCDKKDVLKSLSYYPKNTKSLITVPLIANREIIGRIALTSKKNNIYTSKHLTLMSILANQAAVALNNAKLFDKTTQMAVTDGLTGLYNHAYIYTELEYQLQKVNNTGGVFSLIILDVDHFKTYNDMYGHVVGDSVLQHLAKVLRNNVRDRDTVGRYGGEEFAIILPGISSIEAREIADRIRRVVQKTVFATCGEEKIYITISAGIASYPHDALTVDDLVNKADKAMLVGAKQRGRNKVVMFRPNIS
ncbi:MAG: diguanylate cyclase [Tepidanaerobacteraceae bacterium]